MTKRDLYIKAVASATWWERPAGWLPMPNITASDNKFAGLYAVWEEDVDNNTITIDVGAGLTINYGDGTVISSIAGTNTHNYDYATISGAVLVSSYGRNYKMVMVEVDLTGVITMSLNQIISGRPNRPTGWLDILASGSNLRIINISGLGFAKYLERFRVLNMSATGVNVSSAFANLSSIRVVDYPLLTNGIAFNGTFLNSSDIRDSNGNPLNITGASGFDFRTFATTSGLTKIGNIDYPTATLSAPNGSFVNSQIQEIGNINMPSMTSFLTFLSFCQIKKIGTITVTTALVNISQMLRTCRNIREVVFIGDMSGVTNTFNAFENTNSLTRLILPNITVGFDIRASRVTGTNLQDLFTSLGTAAGAQTITLPNFTSAEDTTIATGKGYTIAYA